MKKITSLVLSGLFAVTRATANHNQESRKIVDLIDLILG